jgi:hypothetical protein
MTRFRLGLARVGTFVLTVLFWTWLAVKGVVTLIGATTVVDDYNQLVERLPKWAEWLFSTPWQVPAALAAMLTFFLIWLSWPSRQVPSETKSVGPLTASNGPISGGQSTVLPLIERGVLRGHPADRYRWWADITTASSAHNVTIYLDLQQSRGGIGPITWCERQRLVLGTRDVIAKGETFQVPLVDEFEREDGNKFIGWCLRGYECDPKARLALGTTSTRCRLFLSPRLARKAVFFSTF